MSLASLVPPSSRPLLLPQVFQHLLCQIPLSPTPSAALNLVFTHIHSLGGPLNLLPQNSDVRAPYQSLTTVGRFSNARKTSCEYVHPLMTLRKPSPESPSAPQPLPCSGVKPCCDTFQLSQLNHQFTRVSPPLHRKVPEAKVQVCLVPCRTLGHCTWLYG